MNAITFLGKGCSDEGSRVAKIIKICGFGEINGRLMVKRFSHGSIYIQIPLFTTTAVLCMNVCVKLHIISLYRKNVCNLYRRFSLHEIVVVCNV